MPKKVSDELAGSPGTDAKRIYRAIGDANPEFAKLIYGRAAGTHTTSQRSFTLRYCQIRHAAISLAGYFTYLAAGTWTGSTDSQTVTHARGLGPGTRVRAVFELSVRYAIDERN